MWSFVVVCVCLWDCVFIKESCKCFSSINLSALWKTLTSNKFYYLVVCSLAFFIGIEGAELTFFCHVFLCFRYWLLYSYFSCQKCNCYLIKKKTKWRLNRLVKKMSISGDFDTKADVAGRVSKHSALPIRWLGNCIIGCLNILLVSVFSVNKGDIPAILCKICRKFSH